MSLLGKLFGKRVDDKSDSQRLTIVKNERPLREGNGRSIGGMELPNIVEDVRQAKEYLFNETVELRKVENNS